MNPCEEKMLAPRIEKTQVVWQGSGVPAFEATKDTNPKDAIADNKVPLWLVPPLTGAYGALAHLNGFLKYGAWNWRKSGVRASVYIAGIKRHIEKWENGEELDEDGVPHLGSIIAGAGIILDARACGKLNDDRPPRLKLTTIFAGLEGIVAALRERHKARAPRHYTIADSTEEACGHVAAEGLSYRDLSGQCTKCGDRQ
jgi:hypothetical protein